MKNIFKLAQLLIIAAILINCTGEQGDVGPKGETGSQGTPGQNGTNGTDGQDGTDGEDGTDGSSASIMDFNLDVSGILDNFKLPTQLTANQIVFVFLNKGVTYAMLPYNGYAYNIDETDFVKLELSSEYTTFRIYVDNDTTIPSGTTFNFRAVIIDGAKISSGLRAAKPTYEYLKEKYNLPDE